MWFAVRQYFRLAYLVLFTRSGMPGHPSLGRILFFALFFLLYPLVLGFNALCLLLDEVFFPGYRRVVVRQPVFVIGPPRSGTTLMHRLLAADEDSFVFFRTWEISFPSILQKKALDLIGALDQRLGGRGRRAIERFEERRFKDFDRFHRIRNFLPEEDDKLLVHILASLDLAWFFPYRDLTRFGRFDLAVSEGDRRAVLRFYRACVKRQMYLRGADKVFLSKNPMFAPKVASLRALFPDCRFVYLARHPYEVIPSMTSMAAEIWRRGTGQLPTDEMREELYQTLLFFYRHPLEHLALGEDDHDLVVPYTELTGQPEAVIARVYSRLGLPLGDAYRATLAAEAAKMRGYKTEHRYSMADTGLTAERIATDLDALFERFAFAREGS